MKNEKLWIKSEGRINKKIKALGKESIARSNVQLSKPDLGPGSL